MALTAHQQDQALAFRNISRAAAWQLFRSLPRGAAELDELVAIGDMAIVQALERYPRYCAETGRDLAEGEARGFLTAYVSQRVRGQLLDWTRNQDHLTRSARTTRKLLEVAEEQLPRGSSLAQQADRAGIGRREAGAVMAAAGAKPVPLEEPGGERGYGAHDVPDESADVESATVVSGVLAAALHVIGHLGEVERWVLVLRYFEGLKLHDIGPLLGLDKDEVRKRWETAVLDIHSAMLRAAAVPGGCACNGQCECS